MQIGQPLSAGEWLTISGQMHMMDAIASPSGRVAMNEQDISLGQDGSHLAPRR